MPVKDKPTGLVGKILLAVAVIACAARLVAVVAYEWDRKGRQRRFQERLEHDRRSFEAYQDAERVLKRKGAPEDPRGVTTKDRRMFATMSGMAACRGFLDDLEAGRTEAAYARTSAAFRGRIGRESFEALLREHPEIPRAGRRAVAKVVLPDGSAWQFRFDDRQEPGPDVGVVEVTAVLRDGEWVVDDVGLGPPDAR